MSMEMTVVAKGKTEKGADLTPGMKVVYNGHVPGGMVQVTMPDETNDVAHPACFKELR